MICALNKAYKLLTESIVMQIIAVILSLLIWLGSIWNVQFTWSNEMPKERSTIILGTRDLIWNISPVHGNIS